MYQNSSQSAVVEKKLISEMHIGISENNFFVPQNELSNVNTTYIDISNGQMFEQLVLNIQL